ncbi:CoB--CoM heterodisulfide reductase iron-sulfur subunit A family protein [candidate division WOR-3 bacterium]|nr:CoB--CoM heterodisulfide reductase iron-sulfur subunit A family protein [candidate division WOR-3 bacterium]
MKRMGVFICHCGTNIAKTVDVEKLTKSLEGYPGVVYSTNYKYMCSHPGQELLINEIKKNKLDGVIIAACSPTLHEITFRGVTKKAGLNPYQCEIANIREQCSWVHTDKEKATEKANRIVRSIIEKVRLNEDLDPIKVEVTRKALVIGGGIAGIQAALDIADAGYPVLLVEKESSIGGHMAQLSETFPTLDCSQCILTPKMVEVASHPNIELCTYAEVKEVEGYIGNFTVTIEEKPKGVDWEKCTGCGECSEICPISVPSEFERNMGERALIYTPFPQAVPNKPVIDMENCLKFKTGACGLCESVCDVDAVNFSSEPNYRKEEVGAIVVATGYELYPILNLKEYGGGEVEDVIDGLAFERLLSSSGPTGGEIKRPSDGKVVKDIVFIQCAGSRDPEKHKPYCSKICCMYTTKQAMLYKHHIYDGQPYIFYIDIRSGGKGYEEFVERAQREDGVIYIRGKVSKLYRDNGKVRIVGVDTIANKPVEIEADLVVLSMAIIPTPGSEELANTLKIQVGEHGFLKETHPKLRPLESTTAGFYLAGCAQAPKDIPDVVSQASGAASKVVSIFSGDYLQLEPIIATVDEDLCSGCGICISVCPYQAREMDEVDGIVRVNEALCQACGSCVVACPSGATEQRNLTDLQIASMAKAVLVKGKDV